MAGAFGYSLAFTVVTELFDASGMVGLARYLIVPSNLKITIYVRIYFLYIL